MLCFIVITLFALPLVSSKAYCTYHLYTSSDSLTTVACSDGANGIMTKMGYSNISPLFPYVTAYSGATWNSPNCGQCMEVTSNSGNTVYLTVIDQCGGAPGGYDAHFDIAPPAFLALFGSAGVNAGVQDANWKMVASHLCHGNKGNSGGSSPPPPSSPPPKSPSPPSSSGNKAIRCGTSWSDANGKCGTLCVNDAQCGGHHCYADLDTSKCNKAIGEEFDEVAMEEFVDAAAFDAAIDGTANEEFVDTAVFDEVVGDQFADASFDAAIEGTANEEFVDTAVFDEVVGDQYVDAGFDSAIDGTANEEFVDNAIADGFYDAATAPTDSTLQTSSTGVQGWVVGLLVLFCVITVLLIVVVVQIVMVLRK